jgi:alcohol dehydrogenase
MLDFKWISPTLFVFGRGRENEVGQLAAAQGARRVLIHYGGGSVIRSGLLGRVKMSLTAAGIDFRELGGVQANPLDQLVYEGIQLCRRERVDLVLGLGGGSAIDSAKAIAIGAADEDPQGDFWDYYSLMRIPQKRLALGTIITLPGTGSEGSNSSVIVHTGDRLKRGLRSDLNRPDFSIMNPELAASLPPYQVASGAADMLSHVMERYFSRTSGVEITDRLCEAVMQTVLNAASVAVADPGNYDAMANLMWSAMIAHNGAVGVGREEDWSAHPLEHEMSGLFNTAHGAGLAALYPAWLEHMLPHRPEKLAQFAERVLDVAAPDPDDRTSLIAAAQEGIRRLARIFQTLGLATNLRDLGIPRESIPVMAARVKRNSDGTCGKFLPLRDADILAIYEKAYDWADGGPDLA